MDPSCPTLTQSLEPSCRPAPCTWNSQEWLQQWTRAGSVAPFATAPFATNYFAAPACIEETIGVRVGVGFIQILRVGAHNSTWYSCCAPSLPLASLRFGAPNRDELGPPPCEPGARGPGPHAVAHQGASEGAGTHGVGFESLIFAGVCGLSKARPLWQGVHPDGLGLREVQYNP